MRKLVTIRTIRELEPIVGADFIELAHIDGWQCVVKKGEFSAGDRCLFFEIDSVLPELSPFFFLKDFRTLYNGKKGYVLRTVKLRGKISQGLALPLSVCDCLGIEDVNSVDNLSEAIGVWKYDPPPPVSMGGDPIGKNPSWFAKTDEERIQNLDPSSIQGEWSVTEKIDGTSMSVWVENGIVGVGGHNWQFSLDSESNSFVKIAKESGLVDWLRTLNMKQLCIQGEFAGPGVQKNPLKLPKTQMFVFMIQDQTGRYNQDDIDAMYHRMIADGVNPELITVVPRLPRIDLLGTQLEVDALINESNGTSLLSDRPREGIVLRNVDDGNRSFKVLSAAYDIKHQKDA